MIKIEFRLATMRDLLPLKSVYRDIIKIMDKNQIQIWDDIYPCEFFEEDIKDNRLYVLCNKEDIVSAFVLCDTHSGDKSVEWKFNEGKSLYLDRFGVNVKYSRKGIGSLMLTKAKEIAKTLGSNNLRLFVVDINEPAINLYEKNGFSKIDDIYEEVIDNDFVLHEYGYEIG